MQLTAAQLRAQLAALIGTGDPFDPAATFIGLGTAVTGRGQNTALSDITLATGGQAATQAVTAWTGPFQSADGKWYMEGPLMTFANVSGDPGNTISVWYASSASTSGTLKGYGPISPAIVCPDQYHPVNFVMRVVVDDLGKWSAEVYWDGAAVGA